MEVEEQEAARRVGTTLCNKWTLERLLGTGGMAAVYVATHKIGRREAIKILHSSVARDPQLRARFEQEAHAVNRFKHPGAVEVRDIDVAEDGSPFLVMELLEGDPMADLARKPAGIALGDVLRWVDELLDVLAAAHAQGIVHRDIKPDNLFIRSDGRLKVLDFGIARVRAGAGSRLQTRAGATLGTAPYMPPEQIRGTEIDGRADLFAVGATMFRLIARRRVHEASSESAMLVKMATQPAPSLASVAPDVPRDVGLVVDRALMFDREQRYPDAATMQSDVRAVREGRPPPYAVRSQPSAAPPIDGPAAVAPTQVPSSSDAPTRTPAAQLPPPPPVATPSASSDALTHGASGVVVPAGGALSGLEPTAWAGSGARPAPPAGPATLPASPAALFASPAAAHPPASVAFPASAAAYPPSLAQPAGVTQPAVTQPAATYAAATAPAATAPSAAVQVPPAGAGGTVMMPGAAARAPASMPFQKRGLKRSADIGPVPILVAGGVVATCLVALVLWLALRSSPTDASIVTPGAAVTVERTLPPAPPTSPRDPDPLQDHDRERERDPGGQHPPPHGPGPGPAPPAMHAPPPGYPPASPGPPQGNPGKGHGKGHG